MSKPQHPNPEINAEVQRDAVAGELADLAAGFPPTAWTCRCGRTHTRGPQPDGSHRCLSCGYIGMEGEVAIDVA
jgi:hypothetical protein